MKSSQKPAVYQDTIFNKKVEEATAHTQEFKTYIEQTAAILGELPSKFGPTLDYHMGKLHLTNEALADCCLINEDMIRRYRTDKKEPKLPTVVALCVGLRLPAQLGFDLVTKAGFAFKPTKEHTAYWTIVATMTQNSIYECNEMLRSMNIRELAKEQ